MFARRDSTISGLMVLTGLLSPAALNAQVPEGPTPLSRYQKIWEISPFVALTDLSGQADEFSGRFALTGFARLGDKDVVFIYDRTTLERFALTPGQSRNGITLSALFHHGDLRTARASVQVAGREIEVTYDPSVTAAAQQQAAANPPVPGQLTPQQIQQMQQMEMMRRAQGQGGYPPGYGDFQPHGPQGAAPVNAIIGAPPQAPPPPEEQPRRIIRRRAILAPQAPQ